MSKATIGTVSHGTMLPSDLIPAFLAELEALRGQPVDFVEPGTATPEWIAANPEDADELLETLFDALDAYAPDGCYFGAHPGDGSDYGFWPAEDSDQWQ